MASVSVAIKTCLQNEQSCKAGEAPTLAQSIAEIVRVVSCGGARSLAEQIEGRRLTPMLEQYIDAKKECDPAFILLFRMGDFFELFFDDAVVAANVLDLNLTSRDKNSVTPIPMAGVPHHAVDGYISRLVAAGYSVAICDQTEDPKHAKGIVKRAIIRLVTPGTVVDLNSLEPGETNYLAWVGPTISAQNIARSEQSIKPDSGYWLCLMDLLAGELLYALCSRDRLIDELQRMGVREVVYDHGVDMAWLCQGEMGNGTLLPCRELPKNYSGAKKSKAVLGLNSLNEGEFSGSLVAGFSTLIAYAENTQRRRLHHLMSPRSYLKRSTLVLDAAARRHLELFKTMDGELRGSLFWHLNKTKTAMGARTLGQWLRFPLGDLFEIKKRQEVISFAIKKRSAREHVRSVLSGVRDLERLIGRVAIGRANPADIANIRNALRSVPELALAMQEERFAILHTMWKATDTLDGLRQHLEEALVEQPPITINESGIFKSGFDEKLDELTALSEESHQFLIDLETRERERTGISKLKVKYNRVFGFYIEISKAWSSKVPEHYERKQTLVNVERYTISELKEHESAVLSAKADRLAREQALFEDLIKRVSNELIGIREMARLIGSTDAYLALAAVGDEYKYRIPEVVASGELHIEASRHPIVERLIPGGEAFVPNDIRLEENENFWIITGPNMGGKSTVMRQAALAVLLAHIGAAVPAAYAKIGKCDRIFTRVGASDNLGGGESTFMVEMREAASITKHATVNSLVILDEIGRGTSTYDGMAIAQSICEYLHDEVGCRTLFATHYHELTTLSQAHERIVNRSLAVQESGDDVVFLRKLQNHPADRSYGVQVAALAGMPKSIVQRAGELLKSFEADGRQTWHDQVESQMQLFSVSEPIVSTPEPGMKAVTARLRELSIETLRPLDALVALAQMQETLRSKDEASV